LKGVTYKPLHRRTLGKRGEYFHGRGKTWGDGKIKNRKKKGVIEKKKETELLKEKGTIHDNREEE